MPLTVTKWFMSFKKTYRHSEVVSVVVVSDTHGRFHDTADIGSTGFEDSFEVGECLLGLWDDATIDDLCGGWDEGDTARHEDEVARLDCL